MPRVSVIIPAYNPGDLIDRALQSVLVQTASDLEVLVVDDGGDEDLSRIANDKRVTLLRQENRGVSMTRNIGALRAQADLLAFLDQDDEWLPSKLAQQLETLCDSSWSYTAFEWIHRDGTVTANDASTPELRFFLGRGHICLSSLLIRREALFAVGGFNPLLRQHQDSDLFARLLAAGEPVVTVDKPLVRVRLHDQNASLDYRRGYVEKMALLDLHSATHRRRWRQLYGAQAFDAFRSTRQLKHLGRAVRWAPRSTLSQIGRFIRQHR